MQVVRRSWTVEGTKPEEYTGWKNMPRYGRCCAPGTRCPSRGLPLMNSPAQGTRQIFPDARTQAKLKHRDTNGRTQARIFEGTHEQTHTHTQKTRTISHDRPHARANAPRKRQHEQKISSTRGGNNGKNQCRFLATWRRSAWAPMIPQCPRKSCPTKRTRTTPCPPEERIRWQHRAAMEQKNGREQSGIDGKEDTQSIAHQLIAQYSA